MAFYKSKFIVDFTQSGMKERCYTRGLCRLTI